MGRRRSRKSAHRPPEPREPLAPRVRPVDWSSARTWSVIARHLVPIAGVALAGWSALESVAVIVLDGVSSLWCVAAIAAVYVTQEEIGDEQGDFMRTLNAIVAFLFVAAILTFAAGILACFILARVLASSHVELVALASDSKLWIAFAFLVLAQVPRFLETVTSETPRSAKPLVQGETGFQLLRLALIAGLSAVLVLFSGRAAQIGLLVVAQAVLAGLELVGPRAILPAGMGRLSRDDAERS